MASLSCGQPCEHLHCTHCGKAFAGRWCVYPVMLWSVLGALQAVRILVTNTHLCCSLWCLNHAQLSETCATCFLGMIKSKLRTLFACILVSSPPVRQPMPVAMYKHLRTTHQQKLTPHMAFLVQPGQLPAQSVRGTAGAQHCAHSFAALVDYLLWSGGRSEAPRAVVPLSRQ